MSSVTFVGSDSALRALEKMLATNSAADGATLAVDRMDDGEAIGLSCTEHKMTGAGAGAVDQTKVEDLNKFLKETVDYVLDDVRDKCRSHKGANGLPTEFKNAIEDLKKDFAAKIDLKDESGANLKPLSHDQLKNLVTQMKSLQSLSVDKLLEGGDKELGRIFKEVKDEKQATHIKIVEQETIARMEYNTSLYVKNPAAHATCEKYVNLAKKIADPDFVKAAGEKEMNLQVGKAATKAELSSITNPCWENPFKCHKGKTENIRQQIAKEDPNGKSIMQLAADARFLGCGFYDLWTTQEESTLTDTSGEAMAHMLEKGIVRKSSIKKNVVVVPLKNAKGEYGQLNEIDKKTGMPIKNTMLKREQDVSRLEYNPGKGSPTEGIFISDTMGGEKTDLFFTAAVSLTGNPTSFDAVGAHNNLSICRSNVLEKPLSNAELGQFDKFIAELYRVREKCFVAGAFDPVNVEYEFGKDDFSEEDFNAMMKFLLFNDFDLDGVGATKFDFRRADTKEAVKDFIGFAKEHFKDGKPCTDFMKEAMQRVERNYEQTNMALKCGWYKGLAKREGKHVLATAVGDGVFANDPHVSARATARYFLRHCGGKEYDYCQYVRDLTRLKGDNLAEATQKNQHDDEIRQIYEQAFQEEYDALMQELAEKGITKDNWEEKKNEVM